MTLDEAILHAREMAKINRREATYNFPSLIDYYDECEQCAEEHEQLAEWMEELKTYREVGTVVECRAAVEKQKEMIAYCDENDCSDCPFHNTNSKYNKCMNDFIADEIVKGGGVNE